MEDDDSDYDSEIARLNEEDEPQLSIEDRAKQYDKDGMKRIIKLWKRYSKNLAASERDGEPFQTPPSVKTLKFYFKWRCRKGKGRLDKKMTISSLHKEFQQLRRAVRFAASYSYSELETQDVLCLIDELPSTDGASTRKRAKPVALYSDVEDILYFLWCCDEKTWTHPRQMVQITFYLLLAAFYGLRPGELVESSTHRGTNEGLKYKDVELHLAWYEGRLRYQIRVALRNRKFKRGNEGEVQTIVLHEELDTSKRFACPVVFFLSLAIADEVFVNEKTAKDFATRSLPPTTRSKLYCMRENKRELPIIRMLSGNSIHPSKILTASALHHVLGPLGERCGYKETITCYAFRRGFANGIEGKSTAPKVRQLMGHANDGILQSYLSTTVGIDTQNAVRGLPQETGLVDFSRSVGFTRDIGAPQPYNATLGVPRPIVPEQEILDMSKLYPHMARRDIQYRVRKKQFLYQREEYFLAPPPPSDESTNDSTDDSPQYHGSRLQPEPTVLFKLILKFNKPQRLAIDALWAGQNDRFTLEDAVQPLSELARTPTYRVFYPHIKPPINGKCGICSQALSSQKNGHEKINVHLIECHVRYRKPSGHQFCFDCFKYFPEKGTRRHEEEHLQNPEEFCGVLIWRQLLIRPGRCPFCMKNRKPNTKLPRFKNVRTLRNHIESHLQLISEGSVRCPHPSCNEECTGKAILKEHFRRAHGIWIGSSFAT